MMQMKLIRNGEGVNKYWNVFQIKTAISASFYIHSVLYMF
jgi:hypothetical protein